MKYYLAVVGELKQEIADEIKVFGIGLCPCPSL